MFLWQHVVKIRSVGMWEGSTPINYQLNFTKQFKFIYISPIDRICTFWLHDFFETHSDLSCSLPETVYSVTLTAMTESSSALVL